MANNNSLYYVNKTLMVWSLPVSIFDCFEEVFISTYMFDAQIQKYYYDYFEMEKASYVWPVVQLHIKYIRPLRFMQKVRIEATLVEYDVCLKIRYRFMDVETGKVITKAESTQMAVNLKTHESMIGSPRDFVERIEKYLAENENG